MKVGTTEDNNLDLKKKRDILYIEKVFTPNSIDFMNDYKLII